MIFFDIAAIIVVVLVFYAGYKVGRWVQKELV
jgi:hypothetical protein